MPAYKVWRRTSPTGVFLVADSRAHAIEIVALRLSDVHASSDVDAEEVTPPFRMMHGRIYDPAGRELPNEDV